MRLLLIGALLCVSLPALGHTLWWTKPVRNTDGTEITAPVSTLIEWSDGATFGAVAGSRAVGAASSAEMPDPTSTRCYRTIAIVGVEKSAPSDPWCKVVVVRKIPNSPTGLGGN
jgi:hypothetical protein